VPATVGATGVNGRVWGTGVAAVTNPTNVTFANTIRGQVSAIQTVTVTASPTAAFTLGTLQFSSTNFRRSATNGGTCGSSLAAGSSCTINLEFAPPTTTSTGNKTGTLTIGGSVIVNLSGRAT
jgi:hypothetical protein